MTKVKAIILAGIAAFIGIIAIQVYWLKNAYEEEEKKFSQTIQVALLEVANGINHYYGYTTPHVNPVQKISGDYYIVNMRNDFDAKVLELLLRNTFMAKGIKSNFEYAIYDCETDDMLYGSYVQIDDTKEKKTSTYFPKVKNLVYYFAVRFPGKAGFIWKSLTGWLLVCIVMIIILFIYGYAIYIILQQERYASLQRDFINNMTHEFKTPLASVLIASRFLSTHDNISSDAKLEQYTQLIIDQAKQLDQHLEKILNVAKHDANPLQLQLQSVDVLALIRNNISIIKLKYPAASIHIQSDLVCPVVQADAFHFSNIIYNFLDNSIKYCEREPKIDIRLSQQSGQFILSFTDNGIGIAPKHLKHVFEKFYRAPGSRQLAVNGFGLGLYYVKKIVELHGWTISASSVPGEGTILHLNMPLAHEH